jgi:hypothetical protein
MNAYFHIHLSTEDSDQIPAFVGHLSETSSFLPVRLQLLKRKKAV